MTAVTLLLCAAAAAGQTKPAIVVSQTHWLAPFPSGLVLYPGNAAGSSFAVNSNGDILIGTTYGNQVLMVNGQTGAVTSLGSFANVGAVAVDSQNNLYVAGLYTGYIIKLPYVNGTYAALTTDPQPSNPPPACTGSNSTECEWGENNLYYSGNNYWFGVASMTFDSAGDLFFATNNTNTTTGSNPYSIFECTAACVAVANTSAVGSGPTVPALLFTEPPPTSSTVAGCSGSTVQMTVGGLAVDPWGNLFFTDSALDTCGSASGAIYQSDASNLKEMLYSGTTYAAPNTLYGFTPSPIGTYDDQLDGVAVDGNGTVYFAALDDGILAFPNAQSGPVSGSPEFYGVSTQGSKVLALDSKGSVYVVSSVEQAGTSNYVDTLGRVSVNNLLLPASPVGVAATATNATVMVNDADCTTAAVTIAVAENRVASSEFAGTPGTCSPSPYLVSDVSSFPLTLTFSPAKAGERSAVLTATDTATSGSGSATAVGVGQGGLVTLDQGNTPVAYTGFTSPAGISVDAAGDLFVADNGANKVDEISTGTTTLTPIGSGFNGPTGTALDANGDLYIADTGNNQIVEIASPGGVPTQSTVVSSSVDFGGVSLNGPTGLAIGPDGVLYISDTGNSRVVTYNPANNLTGVRATGLSDPQGIAVDAAGSLYVANEGTGGSGGSIQVYSGGGVVTMLTPAGATTPVGVAVDASGSVLVSDQSTGNIVRVPNEAGTLTAADATVIEKNPDSAAGLALDVAGNLYTTDQTGAAAYAIQRTASTINFGTINDGSSSPATTVYAQNAGNLPLALASGMSSFLTLPSSGMFTLATGSPVDCTTASSLASGDNCEFTVQFSPPYGNTAAAQTATANFNSTALNTASALITLNGTNVYQPLMSQTIDFTAPASPVTYGSRPITLSATATSGLPVTFSILSGPGSISGNTLTITGVGTIVVAANQAGNADYLAAPQVTQSVVVDVIGMAAVPTFTPAAGTYSSIQSVTLADSTAGASIYYTTDGSAPTISSTLYRGVITVSSTETIEAIAIAPGYTNSPVVSAAYTIKLVAPGFAITLASSSLTVEEGGGAQTMVSVTPYGGFKSPVSFRCLGLPPDATCSFSPATVTPSGASASTTQLTITTSTSAALRHNSSPWLPGSALACALFGFLGFRKRRGLQMLLMLAACVITLGLANGCGTSLSTASNVTVTATSGSMQSNAALTLTLKQ